MPDAPPPTSRAPLAALRRAGQRLLEDRDVLVRAMVEAELAPGEQLDAFAWGMSTAAASWSAVAWGLLVLPLRVFARLLERERWRLARLLGRRAATPVGEPQCAFVLTDRRFLALPFRFATLPATPGSLRPRWTTLPAAGALRVAREAMPPLALRRWRASLFAQVPGRPRLRLLGAAAPTDGPTGALLRLVARCPPPSPALPPIDRAGPPA